MSHPTPTRRRFLQTLGATAALPYLPSLSRPAYGETTGNSFPTRLIVFGSSQGLLPEDLILPGASSYDFELGPILTPLQSLKDKILFLTNVEDQTNILDGSYNGHTRCLYHMLTAEKMQRGMVDGVLEVTGAGGPSIDQVVAQRWAERPRFRVSTSRRQVAIPTERARAISGKKPVYESCPKKTPP